jgi:hypothetical protein
LGIFGIFVLPDNLRHLTKVEDFFFIHAQTIGQSGNILMLENFRAV